MASSFALFLPSVALMLHCNKALKQVKKHSFNFSGLAECGRTWRNLRRVRTYRHSKSPRHPEMVVAPVLSVHPGADRVISIGCDCLPTVEAGKTACM
jgi:hypothetical protein